MNEIRELMHQGGLVMYPLLAVSIAMYEACLHLLLSLTRLRRNLRHAPGLLVRGATGLRAIETELRQLFLRSELVIGALVAAAPLLGLLGTVTGMVATFDTMASSHRAPGAGGLAEGISIALITTETGLAVAIPAVVLMYYARREFQRLMRRLHELEDRALRAAP